MCFHSGSLVVHFSIGVFWYRSSGFRLALFCAFFKGPIKETNERSQKKDNETVKKLEFQLKSPNDKRGELHTKNDKTK